MNDKKGQRKGILNRALREPLAVILVLALLTPGLAAKERRGAQLVVTKKDKTVIKGELLAVREENFLIMDGSTSDAISVSVADIAFVKVVNRAKGALILAGVAVGGAGGGILGYQIGAGNHELFYQIGAGVGALVGFGMGGFVGGLVGAIAGASKDYILVNQDPGAVRKVVDHLRTLAKDRS